MPSLFCDQYAEMLLIMDGGNLHCWLGQVALPWRWQGQSLISCSCQQRLLIMINIEHAIVLAIDPTVDYVMPHKYITCFQCACVLYA